MEKRYSRQVTRLLMRTLGLAALACVLGLLAACSSPAQTPTGPAGSNQPGKVMLILGAYTTPREAYGKIIALFEQAWKAKTGQDVEFQESYLGSGAQSRAIVGGFEADIAALSLETDIRRLADAGLITHDWKSVKYGGMVSDSIVVLVVRKGNPKSLNDWNDLTAKGLSVLTPDPNTSGGAQWNVMAMFGAAKRGFVQGVAKDDDGAARAFVKAVFKNVTVLDKGARESIINFEKGIGDVAITYENEFQVGRMNGQDYEMVLPRSTILIENPIALVDKYVDKHGTRAAAEAFRDFLWSPDAQTVFAQYGLRSVDPAIAKATQAQFPAVRDMFQISYFGGWGQVTKQYFGSSGIYPKLIEEVEQEKTQ